MARWAVRRNLAAEKPQAGGGDEGDKPAGGDGAAAAAGGAGDGGRPRRGEQRDYTGLLSLCPSFCLMRFAALTRALHTAYVRRGRRSHSSHQ